MRPLCYPRGNNQRDIAPMSLSIGDRIELHELAGRYGDIVDDRNWPGLDTVFTEEAVFEVVDLVSMEGLGRIRQ